MNAHHAAALTLVVWYLIVPTFQEGRIVPDDVAPISEWIIVAHADTSSACEKKRIDFRSEAEKEWRAELAKGRADTVSEQDKVLREKVDERMLRILRKTAPVTYSRCVSADNPDLKKK